MAINELIPLKKIRVMDLVKLAGIDVSDWKNYKWGKTNPAANPKYCYEWAFVEKGKAVVLNLWYSKMMEKDEEIFQNINMRNDAKYFGSIPGKSVWARRALSMDNAIKIAVKDKLDVRVIILEGDILRVKSSDAKASKVKKRMLDPLPWTITNYNWGNGDCKLVRGIQKIEIADQFIIREEQQITPDKKDVHSKVFKRSPVVRGNVLIRSSGKCEYCGKLGFKMSKNRIYIETHHIQQLSEKGRDIESNVAALCPEHHREAHYGLNKMIIKNELTKKMETIYPSSKAIN